MVEHAPDDAAPDAEPGSEETQVDPKARPKLLKKKGRWSLPIPSALWQGAKRSLSIYDTDRFYEGLDGLGPVSIFQSREAYGLDGDPVSVAIAPDRLVSDALYAPAKNGRWLPYVDAPHPMEDAEPADILDYDSLALRPLVFMSVTRVG